jgi:hypothetical protein
MAESEVEMESRLSWRGRGGRVAARQYIYCRCVLESRGAMRGGEGRSLGRRRRPCQTSWINW